MPLSMVGTGEESVIKKVGGNEDTKRFLENLGFVVGGTVSVVSEIEGFKSCYRQRYGKQNYGLRKEVKARWKILDRLLVGKQLR